MNKDNVLKYFPFKYYYVMLVKQVIFFVFICSFLMSCSDKSSNESDLESKNLSSKEVYEEFKPLWELYKVDSKGGWLNNDQGRFSNDDAAVLEGLIYLYEKTLDEIYIQHFFEIADRLNSNDDVSRGIRDVYRGGRIMHGWSSTRYTSDNSSHIFNLDDALILYPYVRMYNIINNSNDEKIINLYKKKAVDLLNRSELEFQEVFAADWKQITATSGYFQDPYYTSIGLHMPVNQFSIVGQLCLDLYLATKKNIYKNYTIHTGNFLKNNFNVVDGAYQWNYNLPFSTSDTRIYEIDDIGHASWVTFFVVNCFENNIVFNRKDVDYFSNMFVNNIVKGSGFSLSIDGGGINSEPIVTQYYVLSPYNDLVKKALNEYYYNRTIKIDPNSFLNHVGYHHVLYFAMKTKFN